MNRRTLFAASAATVASAVTATSAEPVSLLEMHKLSVLGRAEEWMSHVEPSFAMVYFLGSLDKKRDMRPHRSPFEPLAPKEEQLPGAVILRSETTGEIDVANLAAMVRQRARLPLEKLGTLIEALLESDIEAPVAECFDPHHAVICYTDDGAPCGVIEICLSCKAFTIFPGGRMIRTAYYDMVKAARVLVDAGLPLDESNLSIDDYAKEIAEKIRDMEKYREELMRQAQQKK